MLDIEFINKMVDRISSLIQCKTASHVVNMLKQKEREQIKINIVTKMVEQDVVNSLLRTAGAIAGGEDLQMEQQSKTHERQLGGGDGLVKEQPSEDSPGQSKQEMGGGDATIEQQPGEDFFKEFFRQTDAGDAGRNDLQSTEDSEEHLSEKLYQYKSADDLLLNTPQSSDDVHLEFPANISDGEQSHRQSIEDTEEHLPEESSQSSDEVHTASISDDQHPSISSPRPSEDLSTESAPDMSECDARPSTSRSTTLSHEELEERMSWRLQKLAQFENEQYELPPEGDEALRRRKPQTWPEFAREMQGKRDS